MKVEKGTVTVTLGSGSDAREVNREVSYNVPENADDVLAMLQNADTVKEVIANYTYAASLKARAKVRASIIESEAGPGLAIEKAIKDANKARIAAGKAEMSPEQVAAFKLAMMN